MERNLIYYFDDGDYDFKEKLFGLHRKKGLQASSQFDEFMDQHKRRQEEKRLERTRLRKEKEKPKNSQKGKGKKKSKATTPPQEGEISYKYLMNMCETLQGQW